MSTQTGTTSIVTMHPRGGEPFDRVYLHCAGGHEVVSAPLTAALGGRLLAGDFGAELDGHEECGAA